MADVQVYTSEGIPLLTLDYMRTRAAQYRGLQEADPIPWDAGLLFPTSPGTGYHMHNVRYAIDICFVDDIGEILGVKKMVPEFGTAKAPTGAVWAIETNEGFWRTNGLGVGSKVMITGV